MVSKSPFHIATKQPKRLSSIVELQLPQEKSCPAAKSSPKTAKRKKILHARNISNYSMCTSAKEKVSLYCANNGKPDPRYRHHQTDGNQYRAEVYVARTCGWVTGDAKRSASEAEENVAEALAKRLHLH